LTLPSPLSICFVAPRAYPALSGREDIAHIGGAERQQVLLAEELARRGHHVSFVVLEHDQPPGDELVRGIRVFKCYRPDAGVRGLRFFHPRLSGLWAAMKRADADVYYQRGADAETGLVGHWCRQHARPFVFGVAHDTDCLARSVRGRRRSDRFLFRCGLRAASAIVAQTERQQELLVAEFGVRSALIRSSFSWAWRGNAAPPDSAGGGNPGPIVWVGRLSQEKRPEWVIRLARELPDYRFDVVGQCNYDSAFARSIVQQIASLSNIRWQPYVAHAQMVDVYRRARLVLCTSEAEGFPNVFLEAWSCGKGVLSTVDPDQVIARFQTGAVASGYDDLKEQLVRLAQRHVFWEAAGCRGRQYVRDHHSEEAAGMALLQVITEALTRSGGTLHARASRQ
jgi:glycosyltransferase involved in cell wall biosynthesis